MVKDRNFDAVPRLQLDVVLSNVFFDSEVYMTVKIKEFGLDLTVKNKGLTLDIHTPNGSFLGDLKISKGGLIWCNGKARSGPKKTWKEFIDWMNS